MKLRCLVAFAEGHSIGNLGLPIRTTRVIRHSTFDIDIRIVNIMIVFALVTGTEIVGYNRPTVKLHKNRVHRIRAAETGPEQGTGHIGAPFANGSEK